VYAAQNLTGNLIANQAVYFFKRKPIFSPYQSTNANELTEAGIENTTAFALGLITSALQTVFVMLSWILTTYLGRRTIYVWGSAFNTFLLIMLGVAATVPVSSEAAKTAASLAQASLGLIISVLFTLGPAPASWVIIGETSSIRLRPLTTGIGRGCYYIVNIPCIFLSSWMLNPDVRFSKASPAYIADQLLTIITECKPRRQVRLRLGWYRSLLLRRRLLLLA
jgi:SP family general alpha glucoside:H+ symporter-like MFS transporter